MTPSFASYAARFGDFILRARCLDSDACSSQFGTLALELFASQFEHNATYRQLCLGLGVRPERIRDWTAIPAAPTAAFKELDLTCLPLASRTKVFQSSGTTKQRPSRHYHNAESLALYEVSLRNWFEAHLLANPAEKIRFVLLPPSAVQAPTSSLVHMLEVVRRTFGTADSFFAGKVAEGNVWQLDLDRLLPALHEAERDARSIALLGTAFNFVHLADALATRTMRLKLPSGSRVMETGGYKGRSRVLAKSELHRLLERCLGLPRSHVVCEYGMSELSSQAYDGSIGSGCDSTMAERLFRFPPWARFLVVSPETGQPAPEGQAGLLRVFDLANVASVAAIQTQDLAIRRADGFELLGRAGVAEPRGCSLMSG